MPRFRTPAWRIAGSFVSWFLFAFSFVGLFQVAGVVIGLGGSCASGGPNVIAVECPESVVLFAPGGIFGMLIAVGIGLFFARSFGPPLFLWGWPILFVGLGGQFIVGAFGGEAVISNVILGLFFVVMGLVPLVWSIRTGVQPFIIGTANLDAQPFSYEDTGRKSHWGPTRPEGELVAPTPRDWTLAIAIIVVGSGLGGYLSLVAFAAASRAG